MPLAGFRYQKHGGNKFHHTAAHCAMMIVLKELRNVCFVSSANR